MQQCTVVCPHLLDCIVVCIECIFLCCCAFTICCIVVCSQLLNCIVMGSLLECLCCAFHLLLECSVCVFPATRVYCCCVFTVLCELLAAVFISSRIILTQCFPPPDVDCTFARCLSCLLTHHAHLSASQRPSLSSAPLITARPPPPLRIALPHAITGR